MSSWTADQARSFELLDRFVERGFNTIDTADVYSAWIPGHTGGESERVLGQWLARRGRRDDIVLMTKVGMLEQRKGLSAANIEAALNDSLKRLGTDYVDVFFALGASNYSAERLAHRPVWYLPPRSPVAKAGSPFRDIFLCGT